MSVLEDKDAIREVMAAYCHALDACRFADVASLFADDGIWTTDYGEAKGRAAIEEMHLRSTARRQQRLFDCDFTHMGRRCSANASVNPSSDKRSANDRRLI
jgi:uncharacterized protein (TIGR02246 family)